MTMNTYTKLANRLDEIMKAPYMGADTYADAHQIIDQLRDLHKAGQRYQAPQTPKGGAK